ncbi:hypothetical protein BBK36DRAFT_1131123 [Trichoderma citrinoviride]|uniref:CPAF-like PDZ domain-containing protein n=1 Tax=Trichoderma citrinoviride TaxID=58853 RepID=A0A2T4AXB0_9HYPO|nr:hypothetical protein BBK36DRAFT_1131123 [Trichoderma citrinoviride]PTB61712.1 hypothetical protein BBK36DRAFT_1131123 [Trichoderma citrinoviride]
MHLSFHCLTVSWLAIAQLISSEPTSSTGVASATAPCARVSALWAAQKSNSPHATPTVAAEIAHDCLRSIPLGKDAAIELVDAMVPYLSWQSDSAYKAHPPAGYPFPGYDIFANLAKIKADLQADKYDGEYSFQLDLYLNVIAKGHDGHLLFYPDALSRVFSFKRPTPLVSISEDGVSLPVVKFYEDVIINADAASSITHINGINAASYIEEFGSQAVGYQDKDAIFNSMFFSLAAHAVHRRTGFFAQGGRTRYLYPGPITIFTLANKSEIVIQNVASITANLTGVTNGESFYAKFCNPNGLTSDDARITAGTTAAESTKPSRSDSGMLGYPSPLASTKDKVASCYYLEGDGFDDVVVISLLDMITVSMAEYQAVVQRCIKDAAGSGKSKLVVDLQANDGGYVVLGYDFFRQLFPHIVGNALSRWKESDGFLAAAEVVNDRLLGFNPSVNNDSALLREWESPFNYQADYNMSGKPFPSFEDKFRPHLYQNTNYTNLIRWNFDKDVRTGNNRTGADIEVTGYGSPSNISQPFLAENIILLYDGVCASICSILSEMLRTQAGIKSVAMGGRPIAGPIQGVGGVKGAQSLRWQEIHSYMARYLRHAKTNHQAAVFSQYSTLPLNRSSAAMINVRDAVTWDHVDDGLPAQYVVHHADCRLYWTAPMITDVTTVWKAAADVAFNSAACVAGGMRPTPASSLEPTRNAFVNLLLQISYFFTSYVI